MTLLCRLCRKFRGPGEAPGGRGDIIRRAAANRTVLEPGHQQRCRNLRRCYRRRRRRGPLRSRCHHFQCACPHRWSDARHCKHVQAPADSANCGTDCVASYRSRTRTAASRVRAVEGRGRSRVRAAESIKDKESRRWWRRRRRRGSPSGAGRAQQAAAPAACGTADARSSNQHVSKHITRCTA